MEKFNFQFCPKIVVFSTDLKEVLLCKRKNEKDYNGIFSFIGGKMETTDKSIMAGIAREKNEEVGNNFKIKLYAKYSANAFFIKKDGARMVLPHYGAIHEHGEITLSEEYSEYVWVSVDKLNVFQPKIETIPEKVAEMRSLLKISCDEDFIRM